MYTKEFLLLDKQVETMQREITQKRLKQVLFVSCGGSLATILPGSQLLNQFSKQVTSSTFNANEFLAETPLTIDEHTLVILNSQSGGTEETVLSAEKAKSKGATVIGFSTNPESRLCKIADYPIYYYDNPQNPYPLGLSIFPIVYRTMFGLIDALENTTYSTDVISALATLETTVHLAYQPLKSSAKKFAQIMKDETMIYTLGAGIDSAIAYIISNCLIMESLWVNSSCLSAGEFFHGAVEAFDEHSAVFALLGLQTTRAIEERAIKFLQRKTTKLVVLDAKAFELNDIAPWLQPYYAPLILNFIAAKYCDELSFLKGHPISSRRYMGIEKY